MELTTIGPAPVDPRADEIMVPMRDGVRLATDVYLPERRGRHPAVLVRLPYDKCGRYTFMAQLAPRFAERGYALVVQDVRGKFRSEGETVPYVHEVTDGYDTIEWIVGQGWSDGVVGMFGDSYYGATQWAAVASGHPALRAIVPRVTSADLGSTRVGTWWDEGVSPLYGADYFAHYWADRMIYEYDVDWTTRPLTTVFDEAFEKIGTRAAGFDMMLGRVPFAAYPDGHPFDRVTIPVLHSVGWFDNIMPNSMQDYTTLRGRPDRAARQYLVADATDHENYRLSIVPVAEENDHNVSDEALERLIPIYLGPALEFFDVFLRGMGDPTSVAQVRWRLANADEREAPTWPPPGARELRLFLDGLGTARAGPEGGALAAAASRGGSSARWVHDPANLVPSTVRDPFSFLHEFPDERGVQSRGDVLTFTTEASDVPLDLAGPVSAELSVSTTGPSMHVFVKLCDVDPDGAAHMLVRGQALAREPDPARPVRIDLGHTGYRLLAGHRLRLQIASSDFPLYLWHPGTAENPWTATRSEANEQTVHAGGDTPSHVSLSILA
jgi:predicted acyl esterase